MDDECPCNSCQETRRLLASVNALLERMEAAASAAVEMVSRYPTTGREKRFVRSAMTLQKR